MAGIAFPLESGSKPAGRDGGLVQGVTGGMIPLKLWKVKGGQAEGDASGDWNPERKVEIMEDDLLNAEGGRYEQGPALSLGWQERADVW